jgi:hypothetical protein
MKKSLFISAAILVLTFNQAQAHHPAEDIVDPDIYAMIDENVSDTPHADMVFDDMGRDSTDTGTAQETRELESGMAFQEMSRGRH